MSEPDPTLRPDRRPEDADRALRPQSLEEFIGQAEARANLRVFIDSAKMRGEAMDHTLFHGPPGLGKTTLAQIMARELGVNFRMTSGPVLAKAGDLAAILTNLEARDVLFIDEIHRLSRQAEEHLYPAMEDFVMDIVIGQGPAARTIRLELPRFTLIGATTRPGLITAPLLSRFGIVEHLEYYTPEELAQGVMRDARLLGVRITEEAALEIGRRSRGTMRVAKRLFRRVRDFAQVAGEEVITRERALEALAALGLDELGLEKRDREILEVLILRFGGGPVGLATLATALSEDPGTLEEVHEPYLIRQGLLKRTPRGRVATELAYRHLGYPPPVGPLLEP